MSKQLTIRLLGDVSIQLDDEPLVGLPSRKAEALLIYLACTRRTVAREMLADLLWDDRPQVQALANLRSILSSLRRALGNHLHIARDAVAFNAESHHWLDTHAFALQMAALRGWLNTDERLSSETAEALRATLSLYRGDFLAGFYIRESRGFEEWVTLERERLHRLAVLGLRRLVQHFLDSGDYATGIEHAAWLLEIDPLSEEAHRQMMLLLARSGQRSAALAQYEACRRALANELGVAPTEETIALYRRIRSADAWGTHNLPPSPTEFIGREEELRALPRQLSDPGCRLITILGPGGIGKTRLAVETARHIVAQHPGLFLHGARFVSLAGIDSAQFLAATLVDALGASGGSDPKNQLIDFLREREMLLLLDNFEFLLSDDDAVDLVAEVLRHAPRVKLLVTSRERLNLREEWLFDLAGLSVPAGAASGAAQSFAAVRLFMAGARRARRDFAPLSVEVQSIVHICRVLQGMPLGIELAAALVRQHSCAEIAAAIERSLDGLTTSLRNVPERQRSLHAAFEYSWALLPAEFQTHFARLSIFPDTFDREAASSVAEVGAAALDALADKSLLQRQPDGRFQIHSLLRQYAAEQLSASPEAQAAMAGRHAAYYIDFVAGQSSGEESHQRAALHMEIANIRAAWQWMARRQNGEAIARTAATLHNFYSIQSWFREGIEAFQLAIDRFDNTPEQAPALCELLSRRARMHIHIGQLEAARADLERALLHLERVADLDRRSSILGYLAITHYYAGDYRRASELAQESLRLSEETGSQEGIAFAFNFMGSCAKALGEYGRARHYFERSVVTYRHLQDGIGAAMVINNLGNLAQAMGDYAEAQRHYRECSDLFKAHDHLHGAATTLSNAGRLALKQGAYAEARQLLEESLALKRGIDDRRGIAVALTGLGDVSTSTGEREQAWKHLSQALTLAWQTGDIQLTLETLVAVAALTIKRGQSDTASRLLAFALHHTATAREARERAEQLAGELGGLPDDAVVIARQWVREDALSEVVERILRTEFDEK